MMKYMGCFKIAVGGWRSSYPPVGKKERTDTAVS